MTSMEFVESMKSMESMNIMLREALRFGGGSSAGVCISFCFEIDFVLTSAVYFEAAATAVFLGKTDQST